MAARHGTVDGVQDTIDADRGIGQIDQEQACALIRLGQTILLLRLARR